jgi:hypothetical protein
LAVDDALLMLPHEAHTSIRWLFQNARLVNQRFNALPLSSEKISLAMLSAHRARLDEAFSYREVMSIKGGSEENAESAKARKGVDGTTTPLLAPAPLGCVTSCAATLAFTNFQQYLAAIHRNVPRRSAVTPLAIGYHPMYLRSKMFERGLFDVVLGPVARLCEEIWGRDGDNALHKVVVGTTTKWEWNAVKPTVAEELPGILERAKATTRVWYNEVPWRDAYKVVPSDKAWHIADLVHRETPEDERPAKKRRVNHVSGEPSEPCMPPAWHFYEIHTRMGLNVPDRRASVVFPRESEPVQ